MTLLTAEAGKKKKSFFFFFFFGKMGAFAGETTCNILIFAYLLSGSTLNGKNLQLLDHTHDSIADMSHLSQ